MAVKIIKNTMTEPIEHECEYCKSIFTFNYQDIQAEEVMNMLGFNTYQRFVVCPVCKTREYLKKVSFVDGLNSSKVYIDEMEPERMERD